MTISKQTKIFFIGGIVFCFFGCKDSNEGSKASQEAVAVQTAILKTGTLVRRLGYSGDVEGTAEIRVFSPIPDRIVSIKAREGDRVKAGQVLALIRATSLAPGVVQAASGLEASLATRGALEDQVNRLRSLRESGAVSSSQLLNLEAQLTASEAQVKQLEATVGQARQRKGDSIIRAPIGGVIGQVFLKVGDLAAPGVPICTVVDMDWVKIKARVPESDLLKLRSGQPVRYRVAVSQGEFRYGTVSRVSPVLDRLSRTAAVEVDIDNGGHELKPGMLARIEIEVERRENAVWVPKEGITVTTKRRGDASIYRAVVVKGNKAVERDVVIGLEDELKVEVLEGLKAGEALVIEGQHLLSTGDSVRVVKQERKSQTKKSAASKDNLGNRQGKDDEL